MSKRRIERSLHHVLGVASLRSAALRLAGARGRNLVLVYHGLASEEVPAAPAVTPPVPVALFRDQLAALSEIGDIVPLRQLLNGAAGERRVRFAVTFDDDDPAHAELALPVLESLGISGTFFLSGRSLHDLRPYWWKILEKAIARFGLENVCRRIGVASAESPAELAHAIETTPHLAERLYDRYAELDLPKLDVAGIRLLARARMEIGFHTVHHPVLPTKSDAELDSALRFGRDELASLTGQPLDLLAYPHGKADLRVARRAEGSGFTAAFAGGGRPIDATVDRFLLGRWEPGPLRPEALVPATILRLHRSTAVPRA